jgi:glycogen debranching enzyme
LITCSIGSRFRSNSAKGPSAAASSAERRSPGGLQNQGWKDSHDSVVHADGSLAEGTIALVEVQGYVYLAKRTIA